MKKEKRRLLSLLLAVILCISTLSVPVFAQESGGMEYDREIKAGESLRVAGSTVLKFTPEKTGTYWLYSKHPENSPVDPYCKIYYSDGDEYTYIDDYRYWGEELNQSWRDFSDGLEFRAGETYYLEVRDYDWDYEDVFYFYLMGDNFIIHQPVSEEAYVETFSDENVTYQWYQAVTKTSVEVTPAGVEDIRSGVTYSAVSGWSKNFSSGELFTLNLQEGELISVEVDGFINEIIAFFGVNEEDRWANISEEIDGEENGIYEFEIEKDGEYAFYVGTDDEDVALKLYHTSYEYRKIDSETKNFLQNPEIGERYYCVADFEDLYSQQSEPFEYKHHIAHQPISEEPYVEGTFSEEEGVSYQWYQLTTSDSIELTPDDVYYDEDIVTYSAVSGWSGAEKTEGYNDGLFYYELFEMPLTAGTRVVVETDGVIDWGMSLCGYYSEKEYVIPAYEKEDATYEFLVEKSDDYELTFYSRSDDVKVKVYILDDKAKKIEDETSYKLENPVIGEYYYCSVTMESISFSSETFRYDYYIAHQASLEEPYMTLNDEENVTYQWYQVDLSSAKKLTPENVSEPRFLRNYSTVNVSSYDEESGWHGAMENSYNWDEAEYYYECFSVELKAGQTILAATRGEVYGNIGLYRYDYDYGYNFDYNEIFIGEEDGFCTLTAASDGCYVLYFFGNDEDMTLQAWLLEDEFEAVKEETTPETGLSEASTDVTEDTSNKLSVLEEDKFYYCEAETERFGGIKSSWVTTENILTHQPDRTEPYVSVNEKDKVECIQWYEGILNGDEIVDPYVTVSAVTGTAVTGTAVTGSAVTGTAVTGTAAGVNPGYTVENGWSPEWYNSNIITDGWYGDFCEMELATGESVTLIANGTIDGWIGIYTYKDNGEYVGYSKVVSGEKDGVYTFTAGTAGRYAVYSHNKTKDLTLRAYYGELDYTKVEGQDSMTLTGYESGFYRCEVEFTSGKKLTSKTVNLKWGCGDANKDGAVTAEDALAVLKSVANMTELDEEQTVLSDVNFDGNVTAEDALLVLKYVANMIDKFE